MQWIRIKYVISMEIIKKIKMKYSVINKIK